MKTSPIAAITGAAGALGGALAERLVADGYRVVLLDMKREGKSRAEDLAQKLGAEKAVAHLGNFDDADFWDGALATSKRAFGAVPSHAALIAGGWEGGAPLHEADAATCERMMKSNVETAYRAMRSLLPGMVEQKHGSIVVVGSKAVERPWTSAGSAAYGASKAAVVALAQSAAQEVLAHGVRINAIMPSTMDTPANRKSMPKEDPAKWVSLASAAGVIAFLLSDDARDVSGAAIPVYGRA